MNTIVVDADRRLRGPYTLAAGLLETLVPKARTELVAAHDIELRVAAPHLGVAARRTSLADGLPSQERILVPGARRTLRIANGLAEFVRDALPGAVTVIVDNLDEADQTDREFLVVLARRVPRVRVERGRDLPSGLPLVTDFERLRNEGLHHAMAESGLAALARTPDDWTLLSRTAGALAAIEREDEALELYHRSRRTCVDPVARATAACQTATILVRHSDPSRRDPEEALGWINEAITITSLLPDPRERAFHLSFDLNTRALVEVRLGRPDRAAALVEEAIEVASALGESHPIHRMVLLANRAQLRGATEEALADYGSAIAIDPGYPDHYLDRGNLLVELGRQEEALADYETAMRISPPFPEPHYNRAGIRFGAGDLEGALSDLGYALELDPAFAPAYVNRAGLHAALGQHGKARRDVERGLELDPGNAHLLCVLGQVEEADGRADLARAAFDRAISLQPDLAAAWAGRGRLAFGQGDARAAVADLTRALDLDDGAEVRFNRAVALRACGRADEARADLLVAARLAPDDEDIRHAVSDSYGLGG
ncbi:tetratricopeptide repeat protein [Nonomuraea sp. NPDC050663]|uniref:tetratricopeptide repeat protein n=1 Tax=Nonomuraea sp. NPDC050663 TaxID=3364370 RepID=UPI003799C0DB